MMKRFFLFLFIFVLLLSFSSRMFAVNEGEIILSIGSSFASVYGRKVPLDTPPIIYNNRTMVPIRFIAETLGQDVVWDDETKSVHISNANEYPMVCQNDNYRETVTSLIDKSNKNIYIKQSSIQLAKDDKIIVSLLKAKDRGIDIKIMSGHICSINLIQFSDNKIGTKELGVDFNSRITVIDNEVVVVGSHDFNTDSINDYTNESVVIKNIELASSIASSFINEFNK